MDGESARDVIAHIRLDEKKHRRAYLLHWQNQISQRITLEPGTREELILFHWTEGSKGYYIVDAQGEPGARFQDRELKFVLTLRDRLERETNLKLAVIYDDTHLKEQPRLQIIHPPTFSERLKRIKMGLSEIIFAFGKY